MHTNDTAREPQEPDAIGDFWDQRYAGNETLWSGRPNAALVSETHHLRPGRALDVGCGEGADALWLAAQGWDVTALDVSRVALERAARQADLVRADLVGGTVRWLHAGLVEAALPAASFDLVSAQYPALLRTDENIAERALLDAVAPGGVLLIVHHPTPTAAEAAAHGFDPDLYVSPAQVAALLDDTWRIEVDETRPRHVATGAGAHHTEDVVVRARRLH
ncbi:MULTISPECIES: class I SAM-dependent methyltransferase [Cryobacterium]|uniref:Methyltransferase type 11 n=1 Tax=Cryobacterium zongtaii TaxID=1259217 RepID=A0A2S3Z9Z7_9MICO|nr:MULTISPECIES: class I SAM-dependent methyltransferase [Cryobacterium]POH62367.1 methyltransferase type 11 [Cryobacterium zongtaii]POH66128.1 methyltransferase type 11 [Cryobacterium zongtaii]TFC46798.1 class I SAM-dependent methyltransferase [Cryobacterium sp. TMN-39-2]TFC51026.1 class I SAM-dependent methyltransferase [Cryobacterium sp. TMB3-1-2]TFC57564.1 class I SAM-dependent methyltransferase [Cryobacterium sp. TMB1-7]